MRKILVISYFFPPCAKSGTQRILKMAEYLPKFNWEPIFLTVKDGYWGRLARWDQELGNIVEPFKVYRSSFPFPFKKGGFGLLKRLVRRIWDEIMSPDGFVMWVPFAIRRGIKIIKEDKPNAIFVTGTPFSSFLIGYFLKKKTGLPLFLDYRDPWTNNPGLIHPRWKIPLCKYIENKIVKTADLIFAATPYMAKYILQSFPSSLALKFRTFTYSFNAKYFSQLSKFAHQNPIFTITFAGHVHGDAHPEPFLIALKLLMNNIPELFEKINFNSYGTLIGLITKKEIISLIQKYELNNIVKVKEFFLSVSKIYEEIRKSHILLLPLGKSKITEVLYPGKFFDYLGAKRPILYLGIKGQVWETIEKTKTGVCVDPENPEEIASAIYDLYQKYYVRKEPFTPDENELKKFESEYVIGKFVKDIEEVLKNRQ